MVVVVVRSGGAYGRSRHGRNALTLPPNGPSSPPTDGGGLKLIITEPYSVDPSGSALGSR